MEPLNIDFLPATVRDFWQRQFAADPKGLKKLIEDERAYAQSLSGVWDKNFIEEIYSSMQEAIANGQSNVSEWTKTKADAILSRYTAEGVSVLVDPSGTRADEFSSWYGDLVFRMASANAYSAGRYAQMFSPDGADVAPFWIYSSLHDDRVREEHAELDSVVFRKDDPSARQFLPPWDFNCRCLASDLDEEQIRSGGYEVRRGADFAFQAPPGFKSDRVRQLVPSPVREIIASQEES
jgi:SPP1 gp7 family putative phage head morphogenesis protein